MRPERFCTNEWRDSATEVLLMSIIHDIQTGQSVEIQDPPATQENIDAAQADFVRMMRSVKLSETDWWAMSDRTMTPEQAAYRQALRDITDQVGFPHDVVWPDMP